MRRRWWRRERSARAADVSPFRAAEPPSGPAHFVERAPTPRPISDRHAEVLADLITGRADGWSAIALRECLDRLRSSTVTEAGRVIVEDAWIDGEDAICVVYRPPFDSERTVGLRRSRRAAEAPGEWRIGDMTTWGYEMPPGQPIDPTIFAWNVADFDIGEPLGFILTILRADDDGIGWWGNLDERLPVRPH
ncbi:MAG: hypothetical protein JO147_08060 [Actinobacteria bacterium]|nr:hypothetical protein [Actinomycetota bacterium]